MEQTALYQAARSEAARMRAAIAPLAPDGAVRVPREQFEKLAAMIEQLARPRGCSDPDCFRRSTGDISWWVPLPEVERERAELSLLRDDNLRLGEMISPRTGY